MPPRLSVIVPMYNVETYLEACLDSVAAQSLTLLDVVMVDDGSTDGSAAIAAGYAARDSRFRLVSRKNGGLGSARNAGLAHMAPESEYVAFLDSDDVIPPDAYRMMVASLDETGSDFATGNVFHVKGERSWQVPLMKMLAGQARKRTHISEYPRLVADRISCNKVWRRSFWEKNEFAFPEGVLYEDISVVLRAHYLADAIDLIGEPVYYWRLREGESAPSITQRRTDPQGVRDRVAACESITRFLGSRPGPKWATFKREYDARVLRDDLRIFLNAVPDGDEDYREAFLDAANHYLEQVEPRILDELPVVLRVQYALVRRGALSELIDLLADQRRREPVEVSGFLRKYAGFKALDGSGVSLTRKTLRIDKDLELRTPLVGAEWQNGKLLLTGDAWIDKIDIPNRRSTAKFIQLKQSGSRRRRIFPVKNIHRPARTSDSWQKRYNYDWSGWEFTFDPAKLRHNGEWKEGTWHVGLIVASSGLLRRRGIQSSGGSAASFPPYQWLDDNFRMLPAFEGAALKLRVERVRALVTGHELDGDTVVVRGQIRTPLSSDETVTFQVSYQAGGEILRYPVAVEPAREGAAAFRVEVPLGDVALVTSEGHAQPRVRNWTTALMVTGPDETAAPRRLRPVVQEGLADARFPLPESMDGEAGRHELALIAGHNGYLKFRGLPERAVLTQISERDGKLVLAGHAPPHLVGAELLLKVKGRFDERLVPVNWGADGSYESAFDPSTLGGGSQAATPLKAGRWNFFLRRPDGPDVEFVIGRLATGQFPLHTVLNGRRYWLEARWHDFPQLNCRSELSDMERGQFRQVQLRRDVYRAKCQEPLRDQVFYLSYNGKQYSDSPRAMHEELVRRGSDLKHLWAVRDGQVELPPTVEKVRMWGAEWFDALASSKYIVTNAHLPEWVVRRPGQVIIQTWHGTMLKKIGHDIDTLHFDKEYQKRLELEAKNWSMLISSNRFSTPILKRAFSFDGEILEAGYPRNDYLYSDEQEKRTAEIRKRIGLPEGKKVVLYAPTWRDDQSHRAGQYSFDLRLDLEDARRRLGDDHVLLIRRHSNVVDRIPGAGDGFVWDVSEYPDIADLYLASDIMITDYSSVMFDYAHLRRPMLFFAYDLEHYRDTLRGFYFDFEKDSPGRLVRTSSELIDSIRDIDTVWPQYSERFDRFHRLFCDLDDGHASQRVVNRMLEQATELSTE